MSKVPPYITSDELHDVKRYLLIPLVLSVFERDKRLITESGIKTPTPYTDIIGHAMNAATLQIRDVRQRLRQAGIKVYEESRDSSGLACKYVCRGYHGEFRAGYNILGADVEIGMRYFLGEDVSKYVQNELTTKPLVH